MAGHRLEIRLPARIYAGISETVLYTGRDLDWAYLVPFGAFYANQYNEKEDDNILWSADLRVPVTRGLVLSGELLMDDFQYESDPPSPGQARLDSAGGRAGNAVGARYRDPGLVHEDRYLYILAQGQPSDRICDR